ncbi:YraN family protein [Deinococcus sp. 12RED42]|uniref:YraN family protein n=1 Tax=Deinococcus sp. 12RED42 TaxID=2745872 RepID=UPI001E3C3CA4|nr:YraN family protein [Deinococcus sp. 12RED42]MCD0167230.1 YraN family protein [Deinococcus sp. 12RED42]
MKGAQAEDRAAAFLTGLGREVLARNYRIPGGEIDVVSREPGGTLVFTEVRQRRSERFGSAAESVTPRKLALMHRAALSYLTRELGRDDLPCRLEVLTVDGPAATGPLRLYPLD